MKNLTIQDYLSLSQGSISNFATNFFPIFTNILAAAIAIGLGVLIGWVLKMVIELISSSLAIERSLQNMGFYNKLTKAHSGLDLTSFVGEIARWIAIVVFLFPAVTSLQIEGTEAAFSQVFAYTGNVVLASLYLIFGFVLAWFVHRAITAVGALLGNHPTHLIANLSYVAFVGFAFLQALMQIGVSEEFIRLTLIALLAAAALAIGLAGKDMASDWLKKLSEKAK